VEVLKSKNEMEIKNFVIIFMDDEVNHLENFFALGSVGFLQFIKTLACHPEERRVSYNKCVVSGKYQ
jgi:predicted phosphatase